jgi:glycerol kinase
MQFQCDILEVPIVRPKIYETTALGAAYLAGLAVGYWRSTDDIQQQWQVDRRFVPEMDKRKIEELLKGWQRAIRAAIAWAENKD